MNDIKHSNFLLSRHVQEVRLKYNKYISCRRKEGDLPGKERREKEMAMDIIVPEDESPHISWIS